MIAGIALIVVGLFIAGVAAILLFLRPSSEELAQLHRASSPEAEPHQTPAADSRPYVVVIAGGLAIAAVGLALVLVTAGNERPVAEPSPPHTPSPSPPAVAGPTSSPPTSPSLPPSPGSSPSTAGTITLSPDGAILKPPSHQVVVPVTFDASCPLLIESGWTGDCGSVQMAGGTVDWVVEHRPVSGSCCDAYAVRMFTYSAVAAGWVLRLEGRDDRAAVWSGAAVRQGDVTGDGAVELIAGFRFQGSGSILAYDLVTDQSGATPTVAAHSGEVSHGSAVIGSGRVDDYSAQYPNNEPNCCPPYFEHRVIQWNGSAFATTDVGRVDPQDVPPSDL